MKNKTQSTVEEIIGNMLTMKSDLEVKAICKYIEQNYIPKEQAKQMCEEYLDGLKEAFLMDSSYKGEDFKKIVNTVETYKTQKREEVQGD